jgi:hypothetical protein
MKSALSRLLRKIAPPLRPDQAGGGSCVHPLYGPSIALPDDYLQFLRVYGPGWFTEGGYPILQVVDLTGTEDRKRINSFMKCASEAYSSNTVDWYPPAFPTMPGLLAWGNWDQGYTLFWMANEVAAEWQIAIDARVEFEYYSCTFTEYLLENIVRESRPSLQTYLLSEDVTKIGYVPRSRSSDIYTGRD